MIKAININKFIRENKLKGPITSPQIFLGKTTGFHPQGLFSEEIFGIEGSPEQRTSYSWVNLSSSIIHPATYDLMTKRIMQKLNSLLTGEISFEIDENGELVPAENGDIDGISSFIKNLDKIRFRKTDEESDRNKIVDMIHKSINDGTFLVDKLIIIPPSFRPVVVGDDPRDVMIDDLNEIYQKVITLSNQLRSVSGVMHDVLSYKMQITIKNLYDFIKVKVSKKSGVIRNLMLGKRVDFSSRAVISPNPKLSIGTTGLPLSVACNIFEPHLLYGLTNSPEAKRLPKEFHEALSEFLGKELDPELIL